MRIMNVMAGAEHGGAETFFERLTIGLHEAGIDQHVVTRPWPDRMARFEKAGITPVTLRMGGRLDMMSGWRLAQEITRWRPDLVMTWMNRATRLLHTDRTVHVARIGHYYDLKNYRHCDHLIANTGDLHRYVTAESGLPAGRVHYVPNFFEHQPVDPIDRALFETPDDAPLIIAVGRLHENKGFDTLLQAMAQLPDAMLWIAGEGPQRPLLETLRDDLDLRSRVRLLGWRSDVPALIATADIMTVPSRTEGFGAVMIEGWANGAPLVCTASEGSIDLIDDGKTGVLVPVDDVAALARALGTVLADPALSADLAENGRAAYEAGYTKEKVVARYLEVFRTCLAMGRRPGR